LFYVAFAKCSASRLAQSLKNGGIPPLSLAFLHCRLELAPLSGAFSQAFPAIARRFSVKLRLVESLNHYTP
jgi:hypothetical protein